VTGYSLRSVNKRSRTRGDIPWVGLGGGARDLRGKGSKRPRQNPEGRDLASYARRGSARVARRGDGAPADVRRGSTRHFDAGYLATVSPAVLNQWLQGVNEWLEGPGAGGLGLG
jgi:hypothetical protein